MKKVHEWFQSPLLRTSDLATEASNIAVAVFFIITTIAKICSVLLHGRDSILTTVPQRAEFPLLSPFCR